MYWQKVPLGWRDAPAAIALAKALGERDARVYLLDLWEWAAQHGSTHPSDMAPHAFARAAFWHGDDQRFFDALHSTGWLNLDGDEVTILSWSEVVASLHIAQGLTDEQKKRNQSALRSAKYRARKSASRSVTDRHAPVTLPSRSRHAPRHADDRDAQRDAEPLVVEKQPEIGHLECVTLPSRSRHASRTEREREREKEISTKNLALFASAPSAAVEGKAKRGRPSKPESSEPGIVEDRERWLSAVRSLSGAKPEEMVANKDHFIRFAQQRKARGIDQLMRAVEGFQNDAFARTAGIGYFLSDDGINKGLARWRKEAATTHPNRNWDDPKAGDLDSWL